MYSESLTVRILGDSSGLQQELSQIEQAISQLHDRISSTSQAGQQIGTALSRVSNATGPLQQISTLLSRITQQARSLSQQPITLNVRPAIAALNQLMQAINQVANQLRTLSLGGGGGGGRVPTAPPAGGGVDRVGRPFAGGGLVTGPSGIDRITTRLTAGEFVLNRSSVETLGHSFVSQLNQRPESILSDSRSQRPSLPAPLPVAPTSPRSRTRQPALSPSGTTSVIQHQSETTLQTINHFGGVSVHLQQMVDLPELLSSIESRQSALRNRRG